MANKKKLNLASAQANKLIAGLPDKRNKIAAQVLKRVNYQNEFDRLQSAKRLTALHPNVKSRMKELQQTARQSLKGEPAHGIYKAQF